MKNREKIILVACLISATVITGVGLIGENIASTNPTPGKTATAKARDGSVAKLLFSKNIRMVESWDVSDNSLLCIVQRFDYDPHYEGRGEKLTIYDESGIILYEDYFTSIERMYQAGALRTNLSQLIVEVNLGGNTTNFLDMLDYRNGKVVKVPIKGDAEFNSGAEVRPQFRRGIVPAKEPYQIVLTEGVGLASPVEKMTHVYRYMNNAYRYVGKFNQHDVDDYIEKLLIKSRDNSRQ